jgi:simple sugar transport system permease protein
MVEELVSATLRIATPILLAAMGEMFIERAGVLNLGIEGTMFLSAFAGFYTASVTGNVWAGLIAAILFGVLAGLLMAFLTVTLGAEQHVSGLGITLLCTALALYAFRLNYGGQATPPAIAPFGQVSPLEGVPILGMLFKQYGFTYIAFLVIVPLSWWLLYRTNLGLQMRAVGENPEAADVAGVNVYWVRYLALGIGGGLMGAAGAFFPLAQLGLFTHGIIAGRGWIAIALVIFGNWDPFKITLGSLIFAGTFALQLRLQAMGLQLPVPYETFLALPYLVTLIALVLAGRNAAAPAALLKAYRRE